MKISVKFDPHDLWIGVYWKVKWQSQEAPPQMGVKVKVQRRKVHIYICILPALPIHIEWWRKKGGAAP